MASLGTALPLIYLLYAQYVCCELRRGQRSAEASVLQSPLILIEQNREADILLRFGAKFRSHAKPRREAQVRLSKYLKFVRIIHQARNQYRDSAIEYLTLRYFLTRRKNPFCCQTSSETGWP